MHDPYAWQTCLQIFCSACPVAYSGVGAPLWEQISRLVLEAAYEATLRAAALAAARHGGADGSRRLFLTLLGGGVFGNRTEWIVEAIAAAAERCAGLDLDVRIVLFSGNTDSGLRELVARYPNT